MIFKSTSYDSIAVKLGLTARQVRTSVVKLKNSGECVTRRSGLFLIVTIVKYDDYQNNIVEEVTRSVASKSRESHEDVTRMSINNNVNNDNNIRSTDIKFLKDAYVKNKRLHQLIYNDTILKIRLFKLVLMKLLWLCIKLCVFRFLTH